MEYYSATKKNEVLSFAGTWMELENVILTEVSQAQKDKGRMFSLICGRQIQIQTQALLYTHIYRTCLQMMQAGGGRREENDRE
jgi:hypothetical protein